MLEDGFGEESKAWDVLRTWREHAMVNFNGILLDTQLGIDRQTGGAATFRPGFWPEDRIEGGVDWQAIIDPSTL